ncbi:MAG TPA: hypothetical protein VGJ93_10320 [Desulfuromonadaceae bacterium]|jgi:hypothetical protein
MARIEMKSPVPVKFLTFMALVLLILVTAAPAFCEEEKADEDAEGETFQEIPKPELEPINSFDVQSGYRFITPDGPTAAASPYERLKSGVTGGFSAASLGKDLKLTVDGTYLHEDDYHSELFFDYAGYYRLHVESSGFWHNLLSENLPPSNPSFRSEQRDTNDYGIRTLISQVDNDIKLGNNPFHLNLGYWQLTREGYEQLRFSDQFSGATNATNTIYSKSSRVDRITREGSLGLNGHLGWFDLSYVFRIRDFANNAPDNRDLFINTIGGVIPSPGVLQAHDTIPDSRVTSHTMKLYSDLSGGLVGTAAYTLIQRENRGGHGEAQPSNQPKDTIHNMAGDLSYTPFKELSLALKYRHQDLDRSTPLYVNYSPFAAGLLPVRPAPDTVKDIFIFSSILRPYPRMIYRLEYSAELESRDNVRDQQSPVSDTSAIHSDHRQTHTTKVSFYWRPSLNLKMNTSYSYAVCDNPAYEASFSDRHVGKVLLTYTNGGRWGLTGSYTAQYEAGQSSAWTVPPATLTVPESAAAFNLPHESRNNSANASFWFSPLERLNLTASYSFLQADTDQTALLNNLSRNALVATNYRSTAHVYGLDAAYAASEHVDLSLGFQQIFSASRFNVPSEAGFSTTNTTTNVITNFTTAGITELTKLDTTETGLSARTDWRITPLLSCMLDYSFRMYNSGDPVFDGSVHITMLSLKARW